MEGTEERAMRAQTPFCLNEREKVYLDMMVMDTINLEEVGNDEGLATYEKLC